MSCVVAAAESVGGDNSFEVCDRLRDMTREKLRNYDARAVAGDIRNEKRSQTTVECSQEARRIAGNARRRRERDEAEERRGRSTTI